MAEVNRPTGLGLGKCNKYSRVWYQTARPCTSVSNIGHIFRFDFIMTSFPVRSYWPSTRRTPQPLYHYTFISSMYSQTYIAYPNYPSQKYYAIHVLHRQSFCIVWITTKFNVACAFRCTTLLNLSTFTCRRCAFAFATTSNQFNACTWDGCFCHPHNLQMCG